MRHDTRKINSFVRYAGGCSGDAPYAEILNGWLAEEPGRMLDPEELKYCIALIPMAQKRARMRAAARGKAAARGAARA